MNTRIDPLKFKLCRISKGILQRDIATAFNVSESIVSRLETGRHSVLNRHPEELAALLGVPVTDFVVEHVSTDMGEG